MHERTLAGQLIDQIQRACRERRLERPVAARVILGEFSGVEPQLLEIAFSELVHERGLGPLNLVLEVVPLAARCTACDHEFAVSRFRFVCPCCGGSDVQIIRGEDLCLASLTIESSSLKGTA